DRVGRPAARRRAGDEEERRGDGGRSRPLTTRSHGRYPAQSGVSAVRIAESAVLGQLVEGDLRQVAGLLREPERALPDDVLLDLVGAPVDRQCLSPEGL